jgi:hypothetical protein
MFFTFESFEKFVLGLFIIVVVLFFLFAIVASLFGKGKAALSALFISVAGIILFFLVKYLFGR